MTDDPFEDVDPEAETDELPPPGVNWGCILLAVAYVFFLLGGGWLLAWCFNL